MAPARAMSAGEVEEGWVEHGLAAELPGLGVAWLDADAPPGRRSPRALRDRLRARADRYTGARALTMRGEPVPLAYRTFFRLVGLAPDVQRPPVEAAVVDRLRDGGFATRGHLGDALLLGALETGVALWALDAERLSGPLGLRAARAGERLGAGDLAHDLPAGRLVVADADAPVAILFGAVANTAAPHARSRRLRVFGVRVPGVGDLHVEEALWACAEALGA
jgi:DNA/RNA-binding domain of Phe-tRNA-synthetase-like protein